MMNSIMRFKYGHRRFRTDAIHITVCVSVLAGITD
jgi:hypothetical protein